MDVSIISALAALTGAAVGGFTSGVATWLNHRSQVRVEWTLHEKSRRQILYRDSIEEASKCYIDALQHDKADIPGLIGVYAKLSAMRGYLQRRWCGVLKKSLERSWTPIWSRTRASSNCATWPSRAR